MFGSEDLFAALNVSAVTTGLSSYGSDKALFSTNVIPATGIGTPEKTVNFYMNASYSGGSDAEIYLYIIACRAPSYKESRTIADTVMTAINRKSYTDYYLVCDLLPTIPPADSTDNYNTPVEVTIKKRS